MSFVAPTPPFPERTPLATLTTRYESVSSNIAAIPFFSPTTAPELESTASVLGFVTIQARQAPGDIAAAFMTWIAILLVLALIYGMISGFVIMRVWRYIGFATIQVHRWDDFVVELVRSTLVLCAVLVIYVLFTYYVARRILGLNGF